MYYLLELFHEKYKKLNINDIFYIKIQGFEINFHSRHFAGKTRGGKSAGKDFHLFFLSWPKINEGGLPKTENKKNVALVV